MRNANRIPYSGTALPAGTSVNTLYAPPVSRAGISSNYYQDNGIRKVVLDLKNDQTGTLKFYKSPDGGTTTFQIGQESIGATGATDVVHREYPVEGMQYFKITWTNGGTVQGTFQVDVSESDKIIQPGSVGIPGSTSGTAAAADGMANPTAEESISFSMGYNGTTWDRLRTAIVAKVSTFVGLLNSIGMGRYNLTPPTLTDGDVQIIQLDSAGNARAAEQFAAVAEDNTNGVFAVAVKPLSTSTYTPSTFSNVGAATTANVKATAGNLFSISVLNINMLVRYLQLFNSTGSTATVLYEFIVPGNSSIVLGEDFFTAQGINFSTGITWGISTTKGSYVAATATDHTTQGAFL